MEEIKQVTHSGRINGHKKREGERKNALTVHLRYQHMLGRETSSRGPCVRLASVLAVWDESGTYCSQTGNGELHMLGLLIALQHLHSNQHARRGRHVFICALH